ncbi:MAG: DEAD/DEAH box helicase [Propionibacteriaceae bacterium]|jgi:superfamily II DNA or RNA helicase|nr:DEAD/DEAH box helicase [Propionibacteriaceae bacterium]
MPSFNVGTLVTARGRDWVVLPESRDDFLVLRPLAGGGLDVAGVLPYVERVTVATFPAPSPDDLGDYHSAGLLRDALRIGFRSTGGPFRSLASLNVDPRPYQYVPLLMALRQETVRLLIADDVGIGKTIEAGLVASELLAQGSAERLAVLCPPSLAEQWQAELREKFGLDAELVLSSTVNRLQRGLRYGESVFERYPVTIVSTDFIKADRRRDDFLRAAPDLVIVDEAHTCVVDDGGAGSRARTQRYRLLEELAEKPQTHLVLVTATPHSGNEGAFRNLLGLLDVRLKTVDLASDSGRVGLARHLVQRRRGDIRQYLGTDTHFPEDRQTREAPYRLSPRYADLLRDVFAYAQGQVTDKTGTHAQQRMRWWSALSLLRSVASSPAAAAETMHTRANTSAADTAQAVDEIGREAVFDLIDDTNTEGDDAAPGAMPVDITRQHPLLDLAVRAEQLAIDDDTKLTKLVAEIKMLLKDGFSPIVFCRFIPTAKYVAERLRAVFPKTPIEVVTGELAPEDRATRVANLVENRPDDRHILVATDCLSEGVNLQDGFQAVVHYDLAWNPTRHEQREGRVDRFGQVANTVRAVTIYGEDTGIDGIVMDVLIRKHTQIRKDLGISVPVPNEANERVLAALMEGLMLRGQPAAQPTLDDELFAIADQWSSAAEQETRSRTRYAQAAIHPDEVALEVGEARSRMGGSDDVAGFVRSSLKAVDADFTSSGGDLLLNVSSLPIGLRDTLQSSGTLRWVPDLPAPHGAATMLRTDKRVGALAQFVLDGALDANLQDGWRPARRAGVITTKAVDMMTTLLIVRFRIHLTLPGRGGLKAQVAEEARAIAFTGTPKAPVWLPPEQVEKLLAAVPSANVPPDRVRGLMANVLASLQANASSLLDDKARVVADELRQSHTRVRQSARGRDSAGAMTVRGLEVAPQLPVDILGTFVYLPPTEVSTTSFPSQPGGDL